MLGLKPVQTAMGEIPQAPVLKTGPFRDIDAAEIKRGTLRNDITVPEILDARLAPEEVVDRIDGRASAPACHNQVAERCILDRENAVSVRSVLQVQGIQDSPGDKAVDCGIHGIRSNQNHVA